MRGALVVMLMGCGGDKLPGTMPSSTVPSTVHLLSGASSGGVPFRSALTSQAAGNGLWFLSPDNAKVTINSLEFLGTASDSVQTADLSDCTPTYDRSALGLTPLLDCPFGAPVGTWVGVRINVSPTTQVLIDDSADGLFTTAAGLTTIAPAAADFATVTVPNGGGDFPSVVYLEPPLVISDGDSDAGASSLSIIVDMNHTLFANVSSGSATFNTSLPVSPVSVIASTSSAGKATFYSTTGTAGNFNGGAVTGNDTGSVRLYYPTPTGQPGFLFFVTPGPGEAYPRDAATSLVGGYLGRDSAGTICWANAAQDQGWAHYKQYCAMQEVTTLGGTTTLSCMNVDPAPKPVSGSTYESGCPAMGTVDFTEQLTLVAQ